MKTRLVATLLLLAVAAAIGYWFFFNRNQPVFGTQLSDLAAAAPADTQFFLAVDLRQGRRVSQLVELLRDGAQRYPSLLAEPLEELEGSLPQGLKLEEVADWLGPAACMSWFPLTGQTTLLSRERKDPPFEMAVAVQVYQPEKVKQHFASLFKTLKPAELEGLPHWTGAQIEITLYRDVLVLTTGPEATKRCLEALRGKAARLAGDKHYRAAMERVPHAQGGLVYVPPDRLLVPLKEMFNDRRQVDEMTIDAFKSMQYGVLSITAEGDVQGFLGIDPASASNWAKAMLKAPGTESGAARYVPSEWANYHAVNLPYLYEALWQTAMIFPGSRTDVAPIPMALKMGLGTTTQELFATMTGEMGVATHFDAKNEAESRALVVVGLKDRARFEQILTAAASRLGLEPLDTVDGHKLLGWRTRPHMRFVVLDGALLLLVSADHAALLRELLAVEAGKQPSLLQEPLMKQAVEAAGTRWIALNYINLAKAGAPVLEAFKQGVLSGNKGDERKFADDMLSQAEKQLPGMQTSAVVLVEPQGLRLRTFGSALLSQSFTAGLMGAILIPNFVKARWTGQIAACKGNLKNFGTALEMWATDHGGKYPKTLTELSPDYLKTSGTCPTGGRYEYEVTGKGYKVTCQGGHEAQGFPSVLLYYSSEEGLIERY